MSINILEQTARLLGYKVVKNTTRSKYFQEPFELVAPNGTILTKSIYDMSIFHPVVLSHMAIVYGIQITEDDRKAAEHKLSRRLEQLLTRREKDTNRRIRKMNSKHAIIPENKDGFILHQPIDNSFSIRKLIKASNVKFTRSKNHSIGANHMNSELLSA
jgi:hypothetical protein